MKKFSLSYLRYLRDLRATPALIADLPRWFLCGQIRNPQSLRNADGGSAGSMKRRRRIAIRRYGCFAFVPHADYLIIGSNFCQGLAANLLRCLCFLLFKIRNPQSAIP
jgi:hypothetical protein